MPDRSHDLTARGLDDLGRVLLEGVAEGVIRREHEPFAVSLFHCCASRAGRHGIGIPDPVDPNGRTCLVAKCAGAPARDQHNGLLLLSLQRLHGESCRRCRNIGEGSDAHLVNPAPRKGQGHVHLVLVITDDDFDGLAQHRPAKVLYGKLCSHIGTGPADCSVKARTIAHHANADTARGTRGLGLSEQRREGKAPNCHFSKKSHEFLQRVASRTAERS
jgi:hypothetical protein